LKPSFGQIEKMQGYNSISISILSARSQQAVPKVGRILTIG